MAWARIDDKFSDHPKVLGCDLAAIGLWTLCLTWARGQGSDGLIPASLPRRFGDKGKATAQLVKTGLWEASGDGWVIHSYSDYGPPRSHEEASASGSKGAAKRWHADSSSHAEPLANGGSRAESALGNPKPKPVPGPVREKIAKAISKSEPFSDEIQQVFAAWVAEVVAQYGPRSTPKSTPERLKFIRLRLEQGYSVEDWLLVVKGWRRSDHHVKGKFFDLTLLGRDGSHFEWFRGKELDALPMYKPTVALPEPERNEGFKPFTASAAEVLERMKGGVN